MKTIVSVNLDMEVVEWLHREYKNISWYIAKLIDLDRKNLTGDLKKRVILSQINRELPEIKKKLADIGINLAYQMEEPEKYVEKS